MSSGIYAYWDNKNGYYVYVGKDSNIDKKTRYYKHKAPSFYDDQPFNRVLQNNMDRYEYNIITKGNYSEEQLNRMEEFFIKHLKTYHYDYPNKSVFNFTVGGDGSTGYKHTPETIQQFSESLKGKEPWNKGKKLTDEQNAHNQDYDAKVKEQFDRLNTADVKTSSPVFRVSIKKCPKCKKGLRYEYTYRKDGSRRSISSTKGLEDLKEKILAQGLIWWEYDRH